VVYVNQFCWLTIGEIMAMKVGKKQHLYTFKPSSLV